MKRQILILRFIMNFCNFFNNNNLGFFSHLTCENARLALCPHHFLKKNLSPYLHPSLIYIYIYIYYHLKAPSLFPFHLIQIRTWNFLNCIYIPNFIKYRIINLWNHRLINNFSICHPDIILLHLRNFCCVSLN